MKLLWIFFALIFTCCQNNSSSKNNDTPDTTKQLTAAPVENNQQVKPKIEFALKDTGQTWFRVHITKNDSVYMDYEGSWPVFFLSNNSGTLQLSKSKAIMSVTEILTIYMNGMPAGKVPIVLSNSEKGTASMIMMPVTDGAYGLAISANEGFLNITKNVDSIVSGDFEAKATDLNNDVYLFKGYFLNAKINPDKI